MKVKALVLAVAATALLAVTAVAAAAVVKGTSGNDTLTGTPRADLVRAFAGDD